MPSGVSVFLFTLLGLAHNAPALSAFPACSSNCFSIWNAAALPTVPANTGDAAPVELGLRFRADSNGYVKGVLFYKAATNTGVHVGSLWSESGVLLATITFQNETSSGWQQALFTTPVAVTANTTYVASYFAPQGNYAQDASYFSVAGVDAPPLHALSSAAAGGNGVYAYGSASRFPSASYLASNYWVDVLFDTGTPAPVAPTGLTAGAGNGQVSLSWTASTGASSYTVKRALASGGPYQAVASGIVTTWYLD